MSKRALVWGAAAVALYLAGAALSGFLSPLARRPLLEGNGPPPPYRWVSPPPDLAQGNRKPGSGRKEITFDSHGASVAGIFSTNEDFQVNVIFTGGAVPRPTGAKSGAITIDPVDPATLSPPAGLTVTGNAYKIGITTEPGTKPVDALASDQQLQMVYPAPPPALLGSDHQILYSADGKTWTPLPGTQEPVSQTVLTTAMKGLGYFEIAAKPGKPTPAPNKKKGGGSGALVVVLAVVGVAVVGAAGLTGARRRREAIRKREEARRRARKMKR